MKRLPADVLLDRKVEALVLAGFALPRWGFAIPGPYNGATGAERVYAWQKNQIAWRLGWLPRNQTCSICQVRPAEQGHQELYQRPFALMPVCRSCHVRLHRRFGNPHRWEAFVDQLSPDNWARMLLPEQLDRLDAIRLAAVPDWLGALTAFSEARRAEQ